MLHRSTSPPHTLRVFGQAVLTVGALLVTGCSSIQPPEQTAVMEEVGVDLTERRVRIAASNSALWWMASIEAAADEIAARTEDPAVRRNTVEWKANAFGAIQQVAYQGDPLVSIVDGWVLLEQMRRLFASEKGQELFGDGRDLAVDTLRGLLDEARRDTAELLEEQTAQRLEGFVMRWAAEHPVDGLALDRRPGGMAVAEVLAEDTGRPLAQLATVPDLAADALDMSRSLAASLPRQVAWRAELLVADALAALDLTPVVDAVGELPLSRTAEETLRDLPDLVRSERAAVLDGVTAERLAVLADIERQRLETLAELVALVQAERAAVLDEARVLVGEERTVVLGDVERIVDESLAEVGSLVDRVLLRVTLLGMGAGVLLLVVAFVLRPPRG